MKTAREYAESAIAMMDGFAHSHRVSVLANVFAAAMEAARLEERERIRRTPQRLRDIEMQAVRQSLKKHRGCKPKAASELGISLKTLYNKLAASEQEKAPLDRPIRTGRAGPTSAC